MNTEEYHDIYESRLFYQFDTLSPEEQEQFLSNYKIWKANAEQFLQEKTDKYMNKCYRILSKQNRNQYIRVIRVRDTDDYTVTVVSFERTGSCGIDIIEMNVTNIDCYGVEIPKEEWIKQYKAYTEQLLCQIEADSFV